MKTNLTKKTLTFGEFVAGAYDTHGKHKARAKIQLAVNANEEVGTVVAISDNGVVRDTSMPISVSRL